MPAAPQPAARTRWAHVRASLLPALMLSLLSACHGRDAGGQPLNVEISHVVGEQPLQLGDVEYTLADGDQLRVDHLRYYLSNFRLRRHDGSWSAAARSDADARGYFLVDEGKPASRTFSIAGFAPGEYEGVEFLVGVDDARNHAGVQSGTLDPAQGMFWTWNTGYIFFKLEGRSPQVGAGDQAVAYHVGGNRVAGDAASSNARTVYLPFGSKPLKLAPELTSTVHLQFDVGGALGGAKPVRIAEHAQLMDATEAYLVADNVATAFRVEHLHHEPRH